MIGSLLFFLFSNDLRIVIIVTLLLVAENAKDGLTTLTNRPFAGLPPQCMALVGIFELNLATGSADNSIQVANAVNDLGVLIAIPSHPPSIAKRLPPKQNECCLWLGGRSVNYPCPSLPLPPLYNTLVRPNP